MNQSKQKADALAMAVREYLAARKELRYPADDEAKVLAAALADYEAIGPDEPVQRPALSPIEELDRADFSAWRHWFEDNGEPAGLSTAMIWDKALRYAIAKYGTQHAPTEPALPATGEQPGADWASDLAKALCDYVNEPDMCLLTYTEAKAIIRSHAPAKPALAEVSARELLAWVESFITKSKGINWDYKAHAEIIDHYIKAFEVARAAKAKEPHAFASLENLATEKPHP